jgi:Protein of unknown function (DUF3570)
MLKINLFSLFFLFMIFNSYAQIIKLDTVMYEKKKLTFQEANLVNSYYSQNGVHSAVTGGIGSEKLTDFSNTFDIKFSKQNQFGIKKTYGAEIGIDYYSSASSDKIDYRVSSASSSDVRFYPSLNYSRENLKSGITTGGQVSFSSEWDYKSFGGGLHFNKSSKDKNTDIGFRANAFYDIYTLVIAEGLRKNSSGGRRDKGVEGSSPRTSLDASLSISRVLTPKLQMSLILDVAYQQGLLSTPFHRVYTSDGGLTKEVLPSSRVKLPIGLRANWMVFDNMTLRGFYRFFKDDWGLSSHTVQMEVPIRLSTYFVVGPYGRYYKQSGNKYFGAYQTIDPSTEFKTSDYDLSDFTSTHTGVSLKYNLFKAYKYFNLNTLECRAGYYKRSDGLHAGIVTVSLQFRGN